MDAFLSEMPSEFMDRLIAYDNAHGIGTERLREIVTRGFLLLAGMWQGENSSEIDPSVIDPWRKEGEGHQSGAQAARAKLGALSGVRPE